MEFVKVRHKDGREAEIEPGEIAFYETIGFKSVGGPLVERDTPPSDATTPSASITATDLRLDSLIDEIKGLRSDLAAALGTAPAAEPGEGETIELREPDTPATTTTAPPKPVATTTPKPGK